MSTPSAIDTAAPVVTHHRRLIDAPVQMLWDIHTAVNQWPEWQHDIASARLNGAFEVGNSFDWVTVDGFSVTSTIYRIEPQRRVLWGGTADGITGIHEWVFESDQDGTVVRTAESWSSEQAAADPDGIRTILAASLESWLTFLERRAAR